jgi:hypothetical protein
VFSPGVVAVSHTIPASPVHLWVVFPHHFNLPYYIEGSRSAGLKLLSRPRTFLKYFLQHDEAVSLRIFFSFLKSNVFRWLLAFLFHVNYAPFEQNAIFLNLIFVQNWRHSKCFHRSVFCCLTRQCRRGVLFCTKLDDVSPWHSCTSQTFFIWENALINKKHFSHVPTRSVRVNTELGESLKILAQII